MLAGFHDAVRIGGLTQREPPIDHRSDPALLDPRLYTVAHNVVVDWRRRAALTRSLDEPGAPLDVESKTATQAISQRGDHVCARGVARGEQGGTLRRLFRAAGR